jgi:hypothetical protein
MKKLKQILLKYWDLLITGYKPNQGSKKLNRNNTQQT